MTSYVCKQSARCQRLARYIVDTNVHRTQHRKVFGVSKSTVHMDVTRRLEHIDPELHAAVKAVLDENKAERHIRGGNATRKKYQHDWKRKFEKSPQCTIKKKHAEVHLQ